MNMDETREKVRISPTYDGAVHGASMRDTVRCLRAIAVAAPAVGLVTCGSGGSSLEMAPLDADPPRLEAAAPIEGDGLAARMVPGEIAAGFAAFLDGIQTSKPAGYVHSGVPLVHGTVAAVIRVRAARTLSTWQGAPIVERKLYAPVGLVGAELVDHLQAAGLTLVDTLDGVVATGARHPQELLALARTAVQRAREQAELALAAAWCSSEQRPLYVDGGISGSGLAAKSAFAVGIVKSHKTLYASSGAISVVTSLPMGARSTAFEIRSPRRTTVASWYLRLRDPAGRDPLFGLVRVEIARGAFTVAHADLVSRWILAERAPLSLPDKRWSTMAYGIRDCEEYLRATA